MGTAETAAEKISVVVETVGIVLDLVAVDLVDYGNTVVAELLA